ncbi:hypothetical protein CSA08_01995 [Candidatus Gracilibacteria bacterium]|nr:MAG: hypothetical protein CSA08_01995 [Candidatus Gracilibacteria bacterium]
MKYRFIEVEGILGYDFPIIDFEIIDEGEYKGSNISHLSGLSGELVREIVENLEKLKRGELDYYDFGTEDSIFVDVGGKDCKNEYYRGKTIISKAFSDYEKEVPFEEIYTLMKDYLAEIEKWEKRTGMKKPGW